MQANMRLVKQSFHFFHTQVILNSNIANQKV